MKQITIQEKWEIDSKDKEFLDQFKPIEDIKIKIIDYRIKGIENPIFITIAEIEEYLLNNNKKESKPGWSSGGSSSGGSSGGSGGDSNGSGGESSTQTYPGSDGKQVDNDEYFGKDATEEGKVKVLSERLNVPNGKAKDMKQAIEDYSSSEYRNIRHAQRGSNKDDPNYNKYKQQGKDLDKFITKSPKFKGEIYRGVNLNESQAKSLTDMVGQKMDMKGSSSWTSDKKISNQFAAKGTNIRTTFVVQNKSGASIMHMSKNPKEGEVLHPSTSKFKVVSAKITRDYESYDTMRVHLVEI